MVVSPVMESLAMVELAAMNELQEQFGLAYDHDLVRMKPGLCRPCFRGSGLFVYLSPDDVSRVAFAITWMKIV